MGIQEPIELATRKSKLRFQAKAELADALLAIIDSEVATQAEREVAIQALQILIEGNVNGKKIRNSH